jgi:hypothetical protein
MYSQPSDWASEGIRKALEESGHPFDEVPVVGNWAARTWLNLLKVQPPAVTVHRDGVLWVTLAGEGLNNLGSVIGAITRDVAA